jgi:hypothetical protein
LAAKDLDLAEATLREWVQHAGIDGGKGPAGALMVRCKVS